LIKVKYFVSNLIRPTYMIGGLNCMNNIIKGIGLNIITHIWLTVRNIPLCGIDNTTHLLPFRIYFLLKVIHTIHNRRSSDSSVKLIVI